MFVVDKTMKKILFIATVIGAATLFGCSRATGEPQGEAQAIRICSDVQGEAVAGKAAYNNKDVVDGLQILRIDAAQVPTNFSDATLLVANRVDNATHVSFTTPQYYDLTNSSYFIGYFPATSNDGKRASWKMNGKMDIMTTEKDIYDAGSIFAQKVPVMRFRHALAQLEVICTSEQGTTETARERWGQIEYIKIKETAPYVEFWFNDRLLMYINYFPEAIALSQADYTADFAPIDIPDVGSTVVNAAGMFAPSGQKFSLLVKMKNSSADQEVLVDMGASKSFDKGKRHIVTVIFSAKEIKVKTTIDEWKTGDSNTIQIQ